MLLLFAACTPKEITIDIYHHYMSRKKQIIVDHVNRFSSDHPQTKINLLFKPWQELEKMLNRVNRVSRGEFRGVFFIPHDRIGQLVAAGLIRPVTAYLKQHRNRYLPNALQAVRYQGHYYGLPVSMECISMYYNRKLVSNPPRTMAEMLALSDRFLQPARGRFLLLFPLHIPYFSLPWVFACGGKVFNAAGRVDLNQPGNGAAFLAARKLLHDRLQIPFLEEMDIALKFQKEEVPFIISGPWNVTMLKNQKRFLAISPVPVLDNGRAVKTFLGVQCLAVSAGLGKEEMARLTSLFEHLYHSGFSRSLSLQAKYVSPLIRDHEDPGIKADPIIAGFNRQARTAIPMNNTPEMARLWSALNSDVMKSLLDTGSTPAALLPILQEKLQKAP